MASKVTDLTKMGSHWYATYQDGNSSMTMRGPTSFASTMSEAEVIAAIRAKTPGIEIALKRPLTPHRSTEDGE